MGGDRTMMEQRFQRFAAVSVLKCDVSEVVELAVYRCGKGVCISRRPDCRHSVHSAGFRQYARRFIKNGRGPAAPRKIARICNPRWWSSPSIGAERVCKFPGDLTAGTLCTALGSASTPVDL